MKYDANLNVLTKQALRLTFPLHSLLYIFQSIRFLLFQWAWLFSSNKSEILSYIALVSWLKNGKFFIKIIKFERVVSVVIGLTATVQNKKNIQLGKFEQFNEAGCDNGWNY